MPRIRVLNKYLERRRTLRRRSTPAEQALWNYLRARRFHDLKFRRQYSIGNYIVDFYCPEKRLVVEIDGEGHSTEQQQAYDEARTAWLNTMYVKVIRFSNGEVIDNIAGVLIKLECITTSPSPSSCKEGNLNKD
jgi:very-short-patch-repair endonuclease